MVKYRLLLAIPAAAVVALLAALALVPAAHHGTLFAVEVALAKAAAAAGSVAAALRFGRGDYLRKSWLCIAACYGLILLYDLLFRYGPLAGNDVGSSAVILAANSFQIVGTVLLARVLRVAGVEVAGTRAQRWALQAGATTLAVAAAGYMTWTSLYNVLAGEYGDLVDLFASLADIVSFSLIAPMVLTVVALRGGSLVWAWAFLTAGEIGWLLYDAVSWLSLAGVMSDERIKPPAECLRLAACMFGMIAGIAQRWGMTTAPPDRE